MAFHITPIHRKYNYKECIIQLKIKGGYSEIQAKLIQCKLSPKSRLIGMNDYTFHIHP